ncbi:polysaccharide pyruvyl transferase family protein [Rhodocaloribacter sp.]
MILGIVGTSTWNKGAELMQVAINEHLRRYPGIYLAVPGEFGAFDERARYGLRYLLPPLRLGRARLGMYLLPEALRKAFGVVREDEVEAVLDASGFAFGDQHPLERTVRFAGDVERWRAQGKPVVLLPQALGPFEQPEMRAAFARVLKAATLVYARDRISFDHAKRVWPEAANLRMAPDFTNLVKPLPPEEIGALNRVCIVPNQRMIEKATTQEQAAAYVPLMAQAVQAVEAHGVEPVLLVHGAHDAPLVEAVQAHVGHTLPVIKETDPVRIKAELGRSRLVIASRFHALVSALTQGVPAIATSWSHKYEMLFEDYGCPELVLSVSATEEQVRAAVDRTLGADRLEIERVLEERETRVREKVEGMWQEVDSSLGLSMNDT